MGARLRGFFDVRSGEALPVSLTFLYIAVVVAAFLLAKPIRNALFLRQYGPYALVYVYAAVPLALSVFVPIYARVAARFGQRAVTVWSLVFFAANVLLFWWMFRRHPFPLLPGVFYVQDALAVRSALLQPPVHVENKRCVADRIVVVQHLPPEPGRHALAAELMALFRGAINLLLVLATLILAASVVVSIANAKIRRRGLARRGKAHRHPFGETLAEIRRTPYLRLIAAMVFLVAIATQWTGFQLSVVADRRFSGNAEALTRFFGTFNFILGIVSLFVQLTLTASVASTATGTSPETVSPGPGLRMPTAGRESPPWPMSVAIIRSAAGSVTKASAATQGRRFVRPG